LNATFSLKFWTTGCTKAEEILALKEKTPLSTHCSMMAAMFQDGGLTYLDRSSSLLQIDHLAEKRKSRNSQFTGN